MPTLTLHPTSTIYNRQHNSGSFSTPCWYTGSAEAHNLISSSDVDNYITASIQSQSGSIAFGYDTPEFALPPNTYLRDNFSIKTTFTISAVARRDEFSLTAFNVHTNSGSAGEFQITLQDVILTAGYPTHAVLQEFPKEHFRWNNGHYIGDFLTSSLDNLGTRLAITKIINGDGTPGNEGLRIYEIKLEIDYTYRYYPTDTSTSGEANVILDNGITKISEGLVKIE